MNKLREDVDDIILVLDKILPFIFADSSNDMTNIGSAMLKYPQYELKFRKYVKKIKASEEAYQKRLREVYDKKGKYNEI
jgi:hypothetical protein